MVKLLCVIILSKTGYAMTKGDCHVQLRPRLCDLTSSSFDKIEADTRDVSHIAFFVKCLLVTIRKKVNHSFMGKNMTMHKSKVKSL